MNNTFSQATREQLIDRIAENNGLSRGQANLVVRMFCKGLESLLEEGYNGISLPKYFSLSVSELTFKDRFNINSKTRSNKKFKRIYFKPSKRWKRIVNSR